MSTVSMDHARGSVGYARDQSSVRWVAAIGIFIVVVGILVLVLHSFTRMNVKDLFVDPAAKGNLAAHVGFFSHLGVLLLWAGAAMLAGSAYVTRRRSGSRFVVALAGLLAWMALDDLYLIHEELGGVFSRVFLPTVDRRLLEGIVFAVLGTAWLAFLVRYRREIVQTPVLLLIAALVALGASVGIDIGEVIVEGWVEASPDRATAVTVLEDMFKLAGIMALAVYAGNVARGLVQRAMMHD